MPRSASSSATKNNSDKNVFAPELNLNGLGLSYDDIQRGKAGDFDLVIENVRRKGKRSGRV